MDYFYANGSGHPDDGSSCINEGFTEDNNSNKRGSGRQNYNRFKVYHRKLDFSHVGSRVCIDYPQQNILHKFSHFVHIPYSLFYKTKTLVTCNAVFLCNHSPKLIDVCRSTVD